MIAVPINHISVDNRGVAYISGTRLKVSHIAIQRIAWNKTPEQIQQDYPHLTLGEVYSAIAYYCDNQQEIDKEISEAERYAEDIRKKQPQQSSREELLDKITAICTDSLPE